MLEARPPAGVGVLSLLDEECLFPQVLPGELDSGRGRSKACSHWVPGPDTVWFSHALDARPQFDLPASFLRPVSQGNDTSFGEKLRKEAGWHPRFSYDARAPGTDFCIHHSSGSVVYSCATMLDKNRDTLSQGGCLGWWV